MDGLISAVLLKELGMINSVKFVHPKDMQDGKIEVTNNDILTNLPYNKNAYLVFDHHESELIRNQRSDNYIIDANAPSAARIVYEYYGGKEAFPRISDEMMKAVDKADSAKFSMDDILNPKDWVLLSFLMDSRTGLGRFKNFRISNYQLMMHLIDYCITSSIDDILELPDVKERIVLYKKYEEAFKKQIKENSKVYKNLVVLDIRNVDIIYPGNRFMIYALFPEANISIHRIWGFKKQNQVFATGKSIFNKSSKVDIGALMLKYEGGGHKNAGTCQIRNEKADEVLEKLIEEITNYK
jgi:nanoRNase/pAp phosphatase (c-di-AMP/oligoRNAs hydrolase)